MSKQPLTDKDGEVRELTLAEIKRMRPAKDVLPPDLHALIINRKRGQRGKQKAPTKNQITLRLDPEIIAFFKATGTGWQSRINDMLKQVVALAEIRK